MTIHIRGRIISFTLLYCEAATVQTYEYFYYFYNMAISFYLNFITPDFGRKKIDEPDGFDAVGFSIKQDSGRKGRDVLFAGGEESKFSLSAMKNHCFEEMVVADRRHGYEAEVKFEIEYDDETAIIGDVDFSKVSTNRIDRFEFSVVQESTESIYKSRFDSTVNLFSPLDLDGNPIEPCQTVDMLLKAKPEPRISEWNNPIIGQEVVLDNPAQNADYFNVIKNQVKYDIKDSLSWLLDYSTDNDGAFKNFAYIKAQENQKNVKIEFTFDALYKYRPQENNSNTDKAGQVLLRVYYGQFNETTDTVISYQQINVWNSTAFQGTSNQQQQLPTTLTATIPFVNRTDRVWISFVSATRNGAVNRVKFNACTVKITSTSIAYNTVIPVVRYIDAVEYAVDSSSNLGISAPRYSYGGELYEQYITSAQLMRNLRDKPFYVSNKDIVEDNIRPEVDGDYEIQPDNKVFFGFYEDFYRNYEIGRYEHAQYEDFDITTNDKYTCNKVNIQFKNYASLKENEQDNTLDIVHGELEGILPNKNVSDSRDVSIGFIRDAFLIEQTRQKAYNVNDNTATSDDTKVFIIDAVPLASGITFTETAQLQHQYNDQNDTLTLSNAGEFNWKLLGITTGSPFIIQAGGNEGAYIVGAVNNTSIILGGGTPISILETNTTFKYFISSSVTLTNRTNEGFSLISGIADGNNYANLRFTTGRILRKYYNRELATNCINRPNEPIRINKYLNNGDAITQITGELAIRENADFIPTDPILSDRLYKMTIIMSFAEYMRMSRLLRIERGYISAWDAEGLPIKGYILNGTWLPLTPLDRYYDEDDFIGKFECTLEEKYVPNILDITAIGKVIILNGETQPTSFSFTIYELGYLSIFDSNGRLLNIPVQYNRVKINNTLMSSPEELGMVLTQYQ